MGSATNHPYSRRQFLAATGGLAGLAAIAALPAEMATASPRFSAYPFTLGLASGDPLPDGVVLWTRLAPEPLASDGLGGMPPRRVPVQWQVATDSDMRRVVRRGTALASPELAHSVHVEVAGLESGRDYYYQFRSGPAHSPVGRTKTAPALGHPAGPVQLRLRLLPGLPVGLLPGVRRNGAGGPRPRHPPRGLHLRGGRGPACNPAARRS